MVVDEFECDFYAAYSESERFCSFDPEQEKKRTPLCPNTYSEQCFPAGTYSLKLDFAT